MTNQRTLRVARIFGTIAGFAFVTLVTVVLLLLLLLVVVALAQSLT